MASNLTAIVLFWKSNQVPSLRGKQKQKGEMQQSWFFPNELNQKLLYNHNFGEHHYCGNIFIAMTLLPVHRHGGRQQARQQLAGCARMLLTAFDVLLQLIKSEPRSNTGVRPRLLCAVAKMSQWWRQRDRQRCWANGKLGRNATQPVAKFCVV